MIGALPANAASVFLPVFFNPSQKDINDLILWQDGFPGAAVLDLFEIQKKELFKINQPQKALKPHELDDMYFNWSKDKEPLLEGVWVYYPWSNRILHILNRQEFISLRTNRNFYKITPAEQQSLTSKTIGIIGLSVGHAVAMTLATERVCGKMKLADFDILELSNLNRINTGLQNIGLNKAVITAREIAEIDPFIEILCYTEGIKEENIDDFLLENGRLDVLVDECDSIDIKILCRQRAKLHKIPVVMETSDRGMLDVERYDLENDRPLIHGLLDGIPLNNLKNLSTEQKIPLVLKIADFKKGSNRGKISMLEVGQSISTWPQLASAVTLGGAAVTDVCRRILLEQYHESGRYYIDFEELAGNSSTTNASHDLSRNPYQPFELSRVLDSLTSISETGYSPTVEELEIIIRAACQAPSTGNDQPWKWIFKHGLLYLFHDRHRAFSFGNFDDIASYISFGTAFENLVLQSNKLGLTVNIQEFFENHDDGLVACFEFHQNNTYPNAIQVPYPELVDHIYTRCTNRNPSEPVTIADEDLDALKAVAESVKGAQLTWFTDKKQMVELGKIIGECDRIRLLNRMGHYDFANREMRWTAEDAIQTKDGIDIRTLGLSGPMQAVLSIIRDPEIVAGLKKIDGGKALIDAAIATIMTSSAMGMITLPEYNLESIFRGGMSAQRLWLKAEEQGYIIHPLISPFYLFPRILHGNGEGLDEIEFNKLNELRKRFLNIAPVSGNGSEVFLFKIAKAPKATISTLRMPLEECFWVIND